MSYSNLGIHTDIPATIHTHTIVRCYIVVYYKTFVLSIIDAYLQSNCVLLVSCIKHHRIYNAFVCNSCEWRLLGGYVTHTVLQMIFLWKPSDSGTERFALRTLFSIAFANIEYGFFARIKIVHWPNPIFIPGFLIYGPMFRLWALDTACEYALACFHLARVLF